LPGLGRVGAKESADSFGIEFVLVPEMPVEAPVRQTGILHDFIDRNSSAISGLSQHEIVVFVVMHFCSPFFFVHLGSLVVMGFLI
jgi:hypothetical protein